MIFKNSRNLKAHHVKNSNIIGEILWKTFCSRSEGRFVDFIDPFHHHNYNWIHVKGANRSKKYFFSVFCQLRVCTKIRHADKESNYPWLWSFARWKILTIFKPCGTIKYWGRLNVHKRKLVKNGWRTFSQYKMLRICWILKETGSSYFFRNPISYCIFWSF